MTQIYKEPLCAQQFGKIPRKTFETAAKVRDSKDALTKTLKICISVIAAVGAIFHKSSAMDRAVQKLSMTVDNFEVLDLVSDIGSIVVREKLRDEKGVDILDDQGRSVTTSKFVETWKKEPFKGFSDTGFIAANTGGVALWLDEFKIISLKNIAAKISAKMPAFTRIAQFGLLNAVTTVVAFSFTFLGVDAAIRLSKEGSLKSKVPAILDLAWSVFEVAAKVFFIIGGVAMVGGTAGLMVGIGLSLVAASIGLSKSIYSMTLKAS